MTTVMHTPDPVQGAAIDALGGGTGLISMPTDDEVVRAAIVRLPAEMITDWVAFIRHGTASILSRVQRSGPYGSEATWSIGADGFWTTSSIVGGILYQPLDVPSGATLKQVFVVIDPADVARGGVFPGNMPSITVLKVEANATVTPIGTGSDPSVTEAGYESPHSIATNVFSEVINNEVNTYRVEITTESGADSYLGTRYIHTRVEYEGGPPYRG